MLGLIIPGIPQLPTSAATPVIAAIVSEALSALLWQASQSPPSWGVFDAAGNQVLSPDSVLEFSRRQEYEVSNYPVQSGSFASYNKVIRPFEIQIRFSKGGTVDDRATFLAAIDQIVASIDLYTVVTPEAVYQNVNPDRQEVIRRGAKGAYFLTEVDVYFVQIIEVEAQYTTTAVQLPNAQDPAAQPAASVGNVQPGTPSSQLAQDGNLALSTVAIGPPGVY